MIDNIDKKILYRLHKNSRSPTSLIAKDTGLTREIVGYRMNKMEEDGVIKGYPAKINQSLFCDGTAMVLFKIIRSDEKRFKEILKFIQNHNSVNWMAELSGNADIVCTFVYKNPEDLAETISDIIGFIGSNLKEHRLSLYITEYKFDRKGAIIGKADEKILNPIIFKGKEKMELDEDDLIILKELARNSKIKNIELAKKTSLSEDMIRLRIKKMERQGIILGYTITVDLTKLGLEAYEVELQIEQMTKEILSKLQYYVHANPFIVYCSRAVGKYNVIMTVHARNNSHFNEILLDIRSQFGSLLVDYEFQHEIREMKEIYVPEEYTA